MHDCILFTCFFSDTMILVICFLLITPNVYMLQKPSISNGGWLTYPVDVPVQPGPCNIDVRDTTLTQGLLLDTSTRI